MKKNNYINRSIIISTLSALLIILLFGSFHVNAANQEGVLSVPDYPLVKQAGTEGLELTWKKVEGAKGYEVYKAKSNIGGYKKIKTLKRTKYKDKSVKLGKSATYKVRAYTVQNGEKVYSRFTYPVSARVCKKSDKKRNAARLELIFDGETDEFVLNIGESINEDYEEFFSTAKGPKKKGAKGRYKPLNKRLRWFSTDESIVRAKSAKNITAGTKAGKAYIYVVSHNGRRSKKIPVEVKDFAYEQVDIQYAPGEIQVLFNLCEKQIRDVCSYYSKNNNFNEGQYYRLEYNGEEYKSAGNTTLTDETMLPIMKEILAESPFEFTDMVISSTCVEIIIYESIGEYHLYYYFSRSKETKENFIEISPYWYYYKMIHV